jgi:hypothetical protein
MRLDFIDLNIDRKVTSCRINSNLVIQGQIRPSAGEKLSTQEPRGVLDETSTQVRPIKPAPPVTSTRFVNAYRI